MMAHPQGPEAGTSKGSAQGQRRTIAAVRGMVELQVYSAHHSKAHAGIGSVRSDSPNSNAFREGNRQIATAESSCIESVFVSMHNPGSRTSHSVGNIAAASCRILLRLADGAERLQGRRLEGLARRRCTSERRSVHAYVITCNAA